MLTLFASQAKLFICACNLAQFHYCFPFNSFKCSSATFHLPCRYLSQLLFHESITKDILPVLYFKIPLFQSEKIKEDKKHQKQALITRHTLKL